MGFGLVWFLGFFKVINYNSTNAHVLTAGCSLLAAVVSYTVSLTFTGFLGAFIEATSVLWQHSLQLLKAIEM